LLRSLQEIQPDFEEAKAYAGLWSQENEKNYMLLIEITFEHMQPFVIQHSLHSANEMNVTVAYSLKSRSQINFFQSTLVTVKEKTSCLSFSDKNKKERAVKLSHKFLGLHSPHFCRSFSVSVT
jgi:hypothetical protein